MDEERKEHIRNGLKDAHKAYRIFETVFLVMMIAVAVSFTHEMSPIITGKVILDSDHLLSRSQMTAWIIWMNTMFIFGMGYYAIRRMGKWLNPKGKD